MGFKVLITNSALSDLREIVEHIAKDDPYAAERFGNRLVDQALELTNYRSDFPFKMRIVKFAKWFSAGTSFITPSVMPHRR